MNGADRACARYEQLIDLCRRIVAAHDADDGGPTVAGSLLAELGRRLNAPALVHRRDAR